MRMAAAAALGITMLVGCNKAGQETGQARSSTDTMVTARQTQDTTMVTHDTTVKVDTTVKKGDKATRVDTTQKSGGMSRTPTDTTTR
jgi:hypothetical protein